MQKVSFSICGKTFYGIISFMLDGVAAGIVVAMQDLFQKFWQFYCKIALLRSFMLDGNIQKCKLHSIRMFTSKLKYLDLLSTFQWKWKFQTRIVPSLLFCGFGFVLFVLGLISLFTGHVSSGIDWYSQHLSRRSLFSQQDGVHFKYVDIWKPGHSSLFQGCSNKSSHFYPAVRESLSNGYLLISLSGGLNQERMGITDAVVVARILNATLVIPELDHLSFWQDSGDFHDIFDVDWFISSLKKDVKVVKRVPNKITRSMEKLPYTMRVPRKSTPAFYLEQVLPILLRRKVVQLTKFDYRLENILDEDLQKLRCRVNYHALRFTAPIRNLGKKLVRRVSSMSPRFVAVHLRFEPDILAFTGCYYDGNENTRNELAAIRKRWDTLPELGPEGEKRQGKCPLTPYEIGLMLKALGFESDTYLYIASGEIYGGKETLQPLKNLFPNIFTKEMLVPDELRPFLPFSSRLAAIDYIVCLESDVFIPNNNGNMAKILAGHRRYLGHRRTIRPNIKKLRPLFKAQNNMSWQAFSEKVKFNQMGFMGEPYERMQAQGEFLEFPYACIC